MNKEFLQLMMDKTGFPEEAKSALLESARKLAAAGQEEALDGSVDFFFENDFDVKLTQPLMDEIGGEAGLSPYTVWMLLLIEAAQRVRDSYRTEEIFWETFADLRCKAIECKEIYNVWGTFVAFWYPIFYSGEIVKLGRLEYQENRYDADDFVCCGHTIKNGDKMLSIHIPSSGEPFDRAARLESYKKAYEYFKDELDGGLLVCMCHSWLLYPDYEDLLAPGSNIADFRRDFDIMDRDDEQEFGDAWRLFGAEYQKPVSELPERTSMQRAFKQHLLSGGKTGEGFGVLIFDGEKLLTRR